MASRSSGSRLRRAAVSAAVVASVAIPVSGVARPADVPAPAPAASALLPAVSARALSERYAATRADIAAATATAAGHGDARRAAALREMREPERHILSFDGRDGGRLVEVFGDLSTADRIAVLVPGAGISVDNYWRLRGAGQSLQRASGRRTAVVAWLGYRTPTTVSLAAVTPDRAEGAASALTSFLTELAARTPGARTTLVCHSYGSVVCARAAAGAKASAIVLYGSPGTGFGNVTALHTRATVWAGRGATDWIADVPHTTVGLGPVSLGFGADPVAPEFGAKVFDAGAAGHSDYLSPGSRSLRSIATIVAGGTGPEEHHGGPRA
ncbi:alpha/beta hydrolase family protein [Streptomyces sp. NBC_00536]|uniref:alpha/beta hydrolase n=1 Tax=Streptomyces sp. NBC_00536 TaxID=2975769 RepID=UPI002E80F1EF|nr:alpha/beta hydrolase [Streptomyces sp. NBC_00536]WUC81853.1 alpha/beta hydrolase family protein [Streptomyces sp. NBC_00536]